MLPAHLINQLDPEDMPNDQVKRLAEIIGVEAAVKVMTVFAGQNLYLPKYWANNCLPKVVDLMLQSGADHRQICKTMGISRTTLYVAMNMKKPSRAPAKKRSGPEQLDLLKGPSR